MLLTASRDNLAPSGQSANSQYRASDFPLDGNCRSKRQAKRFSYSISHETIQPYLQNFRREMVIHGLHLNNEFALSVVQHLEAKYYGQSGPGRIFPFFGSPDTVHTQLVANRAKTIHPNPTTFFIVADSVNASRSRLPQRYVSSTLQHGICIVYPYRGFNAPESSGDGCPVVVMDVHADVRLRSRWAFKNTKSLGAISLPNQTLHPRSTACASLRPMKSSPSRGSGISSGT